MAAPLLQLSGIALTFGGTPLLEGVDLIVSAGERLCLVGRKGSGKSTLLKIAAGLIEPDSGTTFRKPDATIRYLPQEPDFSAFARVSDYVEAGLGPNDDRNAAGGARARAGAVARHPAARRAHQSPRSSGDRMA